MTPRTAYLDNAGILVYKGHAGFFFTISRSPIRVQHTIVVVILWAFDTSNRYLHFFFGGGEGGGIC